MSDDERDTDDREDFDELVMSVWPADWPGRSLVNLDDVGDPSAWLSQNVGDPISEIVLEHASSDETTALDLASEYLYEIRGQGLPLPSDYDDDPDYEGWSKEDERMVQAEFVAFLQHWREQALRAVKEQNRKGNGV